MTNGQSNADPHALEPVQRIGVGLKQAAGAVIMLHGRGASATDILNLAPAMYHPSLAYLAPSAAGHSWYPHSFLAPREQNEPWLSSALKKIATTIELAKENGISEERIVVCGFSQGACLSTEYIARHPARYAGLIAFTGGLIGPLGMVMDYAGDLEGTPALFGSGDPDPHVPWERVQESADVIARMQGKVTTRRYPGRAHTVSADEVRLAKQILAESFGTP
ncbi:phospholipase/Carboxylesterase [Acidisarcina polymorpha]|uniref:Phospholipase/Carboxylesterase n=1 Tax=Acidisarcina polymorpha TaxID=2211140 RepID=A0A2Z5G5K1_9BACT|nr:dienelactone hydrolase family protein [Acidisarcina polymorpha]AXC14260.1 phospholipase/Carboxylesterase [Acidisarcina polymorpha]